MHTHPPFRPARCSPALLVLLLGCSSPLDTTTRPDVATTGVSGATGTAQAVSATKGPFYPLTVGNRWSYQGLDAVRLITFGEPPSPPTEFVTNAEREILCSELTNDLVYMVEQTIQGSPSGPSWRRYRQDASGLYELDLVDNMPPVCGGPRDEAPAAGLPPRGEPTIWDRVVTRSAAERRAVAELRARVAAVEALTRPGAGPALLLPFPQARTGELTRLRYPLRIKSGWVILSDPGFPLRAEVAGIDALDLPFGRVAGYRVELHSPVYGPSGFVRLWYGREGYLQIRVHLEVDIVNEGDTVVGVALFDWSEWLTEVHLVSPVAGFPPPLGAPPIR